MSDARPRLAFGDADDEGGPRTTAQLVAGLASRLSTLFTISGADAIGAQLAGVGAIGRQVAGTAEGARLRAALERGRPAANGQLLWDGMRIRDWLSRCPPSPVLEDLLNDLTLLLAPDLAGALNEVAARGSLPRGPLAEPEPVDVLDCLLGVWVLGRQLAVGVELLAGAGAGEVTPPIRPSGVESHVDDGSLLR